jgi:hypothetical protein
LAPAESAPPGMDSKPAQLPQALAAFGSPAFASTLKQELLALDPARLPLESATQQGGVVDTTNLDLTVLGARDEGDRLEARIGVFFAEIVGGCSCGDEPLCATAYGQLLVTIRKSDATAHFHPA